MHQLIFEENQFAYKTRPVGEKYRWKANEIVWHPSQRIQKKNRFLFDKELRIFDFIRIYVPPPSHSRIMLNG